MMKPHLSDETLQEIEELVETAVDGEGEHFWTGIGLLLQWYRADRDASTDHEDGIRACEALAEFHEKGGKPLGELKSELDDDATPADEAALRVKNLRAWADVLEIPSGDFVNVDLRAAADLITHLSDEKAALVDGRRAVLPQTREHAQALYTVAVACLKSFGEDPEARPVITEEQIKQMAERFLNWRLPEDFSPDAGISFEREFNLNTPHPMKHEPTGTNLFDYEQALEMVRYMVDGTPPDTSHSPDFGDYAHIEQKRFGVPNEIYVYKVVGQLRSNTWCDVPVRSPETEDTHDHVTDVVRCICCGVKEDKVTKFRLEDVRIATDGRFPARCGTCGEIIQPDTMTGTKCACSHPTEYGGELCDDCGRRYHVIYSAPNDIWARIAPRPEMLGPYPEHQGGGLLCPDCATVKAGEIGITLQFHAVAWGG